MKTGELRQRVFDLVDEFVGGLERFAEEELLLQDVSTRREVSLREEDGCVVGIKISISVSGEPSPELLRRLAEGMGASDPVRERREALMRLLEEMASRSGGGMVEEEEFVSAAAEKLGLSEDEVRAEIGVLRESGLVYTPRPGFLKPASPGYR